MKLLIVDYISGKLFEQFFHFRLRALKTSNGESQVRIPAPASRCSVMKFQVPIDYDFPGRGRIIIAVAPYFTLLK